MGSKQNIIEINGKKYDAVTGALIDSQKTTKVSYSQPPGTALDGFVKSSPTSSSNATARSTTHQQRHKTQRSQTLIRTQKPNKTYTEQKAHVSNTSSGLNQHTAMVGNVSPERQRRAQTTSKSSLVKRFPDTPTLYSSPQPVKNMPVTAAPVSITSSPQVQQQNSQAEALFDKALKNANSHNQKAPSQFSKKRLSTKLKLTPKVGGIVAVFGVLVILGTVITYRNVPNFAVKVASTRAGFTANIPGYSPNGYSFAGPVQYSPGRVVVNFKSNTNDANFELVQKSSNWNSDALLKNFILENNKDYQTYRDRGRTIYIYDNNSATWVDKGVWYQIEGTAQLSSDQLIKIATSL